MTNRLSRKYPPLWLAMLLAAAAMLSDFFSPNPPDEQDLMNAFAPPSRIRFVDADGRIHLRPFTYRFELADPLNLTYVERTGERYPIHWFVEGYEYRLFGVLRTSTHVAGTPGQRLLFFGADELGRDVLARTLAGARTSLSVVVVGVAVCVILGVLVGAAAGAGKAWIDSLLMRFSEFVLALPALYVILALRATLGNRGSRAEAILLTAGIIAAVTWPPLARGVRGILMQLHRAGYIEAARGLGCSETRIFVKHHLPSLMPYVASQSLIVAPAFLLGEIVLAFLDAGLGDPGGSWGTMLRSLRDPRILTDYQWNLAPLVFVFLTLFSINLLGRRVQTTVGPVYGDSTAPRV